MSDLQGEPEFGEHVTEAGEEICTAVRALTGVRAYVLDDDELEHFKDAQRALRALHEAFDGDHECPPTGGGDE